MFYHNSELPCFVLLAESAAIFYINTIEWLLYRMEIHWFVLDTYWLSVYYKDETVTSKGGMNGILCDILLFIF